MQPLSSLLLNFSGDQPFNFLFTGKHVSQALLSGYRVFFEGNIYRIEDQKVSCWGDAKISSFLLERFLVSGVEIFPNVVGEYTLYIASEDDVILYRNLTCPASIYYTDGHAGGFASNHLLPLVRLQSQPVLDKKYLQHFLLRNSFIPHQYQGTPFEGIRRIPAGCYLRRQKGKGLSLHRVEIPAQKSLSKLKKDPREISQRLQEILREAVSDRLARAGDNKIVAEISGGLDSSFVASLIGQVRSKDVSGYMFSFPEHPSHRSSEAYAQEVADRYGIDFKILPPDTFFPYDLSKPLPYSDEPSPYAWQAATLWTKLVDIIGPKRTIFSGVGSDALFMRSPTVLPWLLKQRMFKEFFNKLPECAQAFDRSSVSFFYQSCLSLVPDRAYYHLNPILKYLPRNFTSFEDIMSRHAVDTVPWLKGGDFPRLQVVAEEDAEHTNLFGDEAPIRAPLSGMVLPQLSMGGITEPHQISYQMPFYDSRLLSFVYSEVSWDLVHDWKNPYKHLLREAQKGIVPEVTRNRPKNEFHFEGFLGRLLRENSDYLRSFMLSSKLEQFGMFDMKKLGESLEMHVFCTKTGLDNLAFVNLMGYLLWLRDFEAAMACE